LALNKDTCKGGEDKERAKKESPATAELYVFLAEGYLDQPFICQGIVTIGGNNQVIQDSKTQQFASLNKLLCEVDICF
jgi:hypothetical protein